MTYRRLESKKKAEKRQCNEMRMVHTAQVKLKH